MQGSRTDDGVSLITEPNASLLVSHGDGSR